MHTALGFIAIDHKMQHPYAPGVLILISHFGEKQIGVILEHIPYEDELRPTIYEYFVWLAGRQQRALAFYDQHIALDMCTCSLKH